jgi:hypothetical protein
MASVQVVDLPSGKIGAGSQAKVTWNNPPKHMVGFWVAPAELAEPFILTGKLSFEITNVLSIMDKPNHTSLK